ncbi:MAG: hypothetical protein ACK4NH_16505 [Gemmobacter sp.]
MEQDIWALLADTGADSSLLTFAVGLDDTRRAALPLTIRSRIAEKLLAAGLPNAAADWARSGDFSVDLAARIALANGDSRSALRLLASQVPDADPDLLAASYSAAGDFDAAAATYQKAGNTDAAARQSRWAGTWPPEQATQADASAPGDDIWATVARQLAPADDQSAAPPLRAAAAQLEESARARQNIADLLATASPP